MYINPTAGVELKLFSDNSSSDLASSDILSVNKFWFSGISRLLVEARVGIVIVSPHRLINKINPLVIYPACTWY
jgi:hypothetical protein